MKRFGCRAILWAVILLAASPGLRAQKHPHVGYIYPAGGRQGSDFTVTVGGQYLRELSDVYASGEGVRCDVVKHIPALTNKQSNELKQKLRELQRRIQAGRKRGKVKPGRAKIAKIARDVGLEVTSLEELEALEKKLFDSKKQINPQLAEIVVLRVRIDSGAKVGKREIRLFASTGGSNPVNFHVGSFPEHVEVDASGRIAEIVDPDLTPVVINGQILPGEVDRFQFTARSGEHLVLSARARELIPYLADAVPGWFQATLALYDSAGAEVAYADDFRFHPDPVLHYEVPEDGLYTLEIKDSVYRGREDFVYRITVGELPFVTSVFPLGGRAREEIDVKVLGWNLPRSRLRTRSSGPGARVRHLPVVGGDWIINYVPFAVDTLPECSESEPNSYSENAQYIELPVIINGIIKTVGDRDVFRFDGKSGEIVVAEVVARRLNSPLDSMLKLTNSEGRLLKANDDHEDRGDGLSTHHADSRIEFKIPSSGVYYFQISDTQQKGGAAFGYRLRVSPRRPDFELRIVPSSLNMRAGTTQAVEVFALRKDGFDGDISLALKDAPEGFSLSGAWVPANQDKVRLTLTVPASSSKEPTRLLLEGFASVQGRELRHLAVPAEDRMQAFIYRHLVPAQDWVVSISGRSKAAGSVKLSEESPVRIPAGGVGQARFSVGKQIINQQLKKQLKFSLNDPPPGIFLQKVSVEETALIVHFRSARGKVAPALEGNLIVDVFLNRKINAKKQVRVKNRRVSLGTLPAIPFEVVSGAP